MMIATTINNKKIPATQVTILVVFVITVPFLYNLAFHEYSSGKAKWGFAASGNSAFY